VEKKAWQGANVLLMRVQGSQHQWLNSTSQYLRLEGRHQWFLRFGALLLQVRFEPVSISYLWVLSINTFCLNEPGRILLLATKKPVWYLRPKCLSIREGMMEHYIAVKTSKWKKQSVVNRAGYFHLNTYRQPRQNLTKKQCLQFTRRI
jgi:hypothetical protein